MNQPAKPAPIRRGPAALPAPKWWGRYLLDGEPPRRRFVFNWVRILGALATLCVCFYLSGVTLLWGYYTYHRRIPGVMWGDIAIPTRFSRVQSAMGSYYLENARKSWAKGDYVLGIVTAKAAVYKAPANVDARLFLASCWTAASRSDEALRALRDGIPFSAKDERLQAALIQGCLAAGKYGELLEVLRSDLPKQGVNLLNRGDRPLQLAELRAVIETSGPTDAQQVLASHPGLAEDPVAAPLVSRIQWEAGNREQALATLKLARDKMPENASLHDSYIGRAIEAGRLDEARAASELYLRDFPNLLGAQLRYLEAHPDREGKDRAAWLGESLGILALHRREPAALSQLGSLAASEGWSDLAFLLYQNSLEENLAGFPFAIYYVGSLIKSGDMRDAEAALRELAIRNPTQVMASSYLTAMIDLGTGRESEAAQVIQQLKRDTSEDSHRRKTIEGLFRSYGFPKAADELTSGS